MGWDKKSGKGRVEAGNPAQGGLRGVLDIQADDWPRLWVKGKAGLKTWGD